MIAHWEHQKAPRLPPDDPPVSARDVQCPFTPVIAIGSVPAAAIPPLNPGKAVQPGGYKL
eukprot:6281914-Prorocentrum_lima.AAC.1